MYLRFNGLTLLAYLNYTHARCMHTDFTQVAFRDRGCSNGDKHAGSLGRSGALATDKTPEAAAAGVVGQKRSLLLHCGPAVHNDVV